MFNKTDISPDKALSLLQEGNKRFVEEKRLRRNLMQEVKRNTRVQEPFAAILSCSDSRTPVEMIFDQGLGDIFSIRIAGNVVNNDILGSLEFACSLNSIKIILVMGHTQCGAIMGACDLVDRGHLTGLLEKIKPAIDQETTVTSNRTSGNITFVNKVGALHVQHILNLIPFQSPLIQSRVSKYDILLKGAMYHLETGQVVFI